MTATHHDTPTGSPAPADRAGDTRDRLLAAGLAAFASRGFAAASVREITAAADANLAAITYHFGSKQGLYDAVLERVFGRLRQNVAEAERASAGVAGPDRVERIVRSIFAVLRETPELPYLIVQQIAATHELPGPALQTFPQVFGTLVRVIGEGQAEGTMEPGNPLLMAITAVSQPAYFAVVARFFLPRVPHALGAPPTRDEIEEHAVAFLRRGLTLRTDGER